MVEEATNAHTEAAADREASLHAKIKVAKEVNRVKDALAHQEEKEVNFLKKKLEAGQQKANVRP
jgi:hypothetical protein